MSRNAHCEGHSISSGRRYEGAPGSVVVSVCPLRESASGALCGVINRSREEERKNRKKKNRWRRKEKETVGKMKQRRGDHPFGQCTSRNDSHPT